MREGSHSEIISSHPAFGQITLHRREGGHVPLYGSDFTHGAFISVRIHASELHRGLNRDWFHAGETYIEIALSEAQWATFVSSQGVGAGVPCTIRSRNRKPVPGLPMPRTRHDQFEGELLDDLSAIIRKCDDLMDGAKTKKQRDEIALLKQDLEKKLPFVAKQFSRHMEKTTEAAKAEVHGYMMGAIQRAGLAAIGASPPFEMPAQAIEARSDATGTGAAEGESAVPEGGAP